MDRLIYQVYVGPRCKLYDFCTASVAAYCEAHGINHFVQTEPILKIRPDPETSGRSAQAVDRLGYLPIFEKENALSYLQHYSQVAVIDADVWIRPGTPSIFPEVAPYEADFGAVVERDMPLTALYARKVKGYSEDQYRSLSDVDWCWNRHGADFMNMGVMVLNWTIKDLMGGETGEEFLARPEFKRFVDGEGAWKWSTDQTLLNYWVRKDGACVNRLHWRWNFLYGACREEKMAEAHFIHFFLRDHLPNKGEDVAELVKSI